jgi:2-amino-4-hydroxy-6-hydroxymethyldihydropteridine diphosphokinase
MRPELAYVGLGANLGDPPRQVREALAALAGLGKLRASSLYRSEPLGDPRQPWYVNAVAELETGLGPRALLAELQRLEQAAGRPATRPRNAPRTLDLDLLLHGRRLVYEPGLQVPHPRYRQRRFVLAPLLELAPGLVDPGDGAPLARVLADLDDPLGLERLSDARLEVTR